MGLMPVKGNVPAEMPAEAPAKDPARYTDESDSNVSPEEQAQYDAAMENAAELMFDKKTGQVRDGIIQALQSTEAPPPQEGAEQGQSQPPKIMALANAAVMIVSKLDDSAREAGSPLSDSVLVEVGTDVVAMLAEHAELEGEMEYSQDELDGAFITATDMYRAKAIADGRTDENTLKGQWDELLNADKEGRLGEVLPGAEQAAPAEEAPAMEA